MSRKPKVVVAMSGGVDSSVAACLLVEQGFDVVGLFMRVRMVETTAATDNRHQGCCSAADASDARFVADKLGVPFYVMDFAADFERIIDYFTEEYLNGRTPNPCVVCNDWLKFGRLAKYADAVGAEHVATGHYARVDRSSGRVRLLRAVDMSKDQSYVLFAVKPAMLERAMFPLGNLTKPQVRQKAGDLGLANCDKPESMEICFVPDRDYASVVRRRRPEGFKDGPVVTRDGTEIGRHDGIAQFTIGQRRGLGIATGTPIYVTKIDTAGNTIVVGHKQDLLNAGLLADRVNWLIDAPTTAIRGQVKIRYQHTAAAAEITPLPQGRVKVRFDTPQSAITPGQAAVFYDGDLVLGGGWIERATDE